MHAAACLGLTCAALSARAADGGAGSEEAAFSGYYKNLLVRSRTLAGDRVPYTLDINRLRLEKRGQLSPSVRFDVQYDNEVLLGSYLGTAQFQAQKALPGLQYLDLDNTYRDRPGVYGRQRLYRAYLTWSSGATDLRLGRQRIAFGTGKFWSPLDLFNPPDPTSLEREERAGADALLVERKLGAVSRVSVLLAPQRGRRDAMALLWHGNTAGTDFSLLAAHRDASRVVGMDLAGQAGAAGVRGEWSRTVADGAPAYGRALLGLDYAFASTLTVTGELYFNGAGTRDSGHYDFAALYSGRIQSVARHYAGLHLGYELTPLLKLDTHLVLNGDDGSRFIAPALSYSWQGNLEVRAGIQYGAGRAGSEFGRFRKACYLQLQRYF
jgi:hypothetical protein